MSLVLAAEPTSLVAVNDQCAAVEQWAEKCESIPELQDATNRLAAIDEYLGRTSIEGRGRVAAAMRRLEARIGALLPRHQGKQLRHRDVEVAIHNNTKADFRSMAEHPEVVEEVIAESTDDRPASRRKVTDRIRDAVKNNPADSKVDEARRMAAEGYSSRQIGEAIGITDMNAYRRRHGIEVPADAVVGRGKTHDSNRIMQELASAAEHVTAGHDLINYADLDATHVEEWVNSLSAAISSLTTIRRKLRELTQ